jgi:hypothetical protein
MVAERVPAVNPACCAKGAAVRGRQQVRKTCESPEGVAGILLWWPLLLWCYGPDQYYTYELEED